MSKKWARAFKIGLPIVLVAGLVTGLTTTVLASPKNQPPVKTAGEVVAGKVVTKTDTYFVVQSGNQTQTTVSVNATTHYFLAPRALPERLAEAWGRLNDNKNDEKEHGRNGVPKVLNDLHKLAKDATYTDLALGDKVVVRLFPSTTIAKQVLIIKPVLPKNQTVTGTIAAATTNATGDGGTIVINTSGTPPQIVLNWDTNTRIVLKGVLAVQAPYKISATYNTSTMKALTVTVSRP